jgi:hypothetical protein
MGFDKLVNLGLRPQMWTPTEVVRFTSRNSQYQSQQYGREYTLLWRHLDEVMASIPPGAEISVYIEQQPSKARSVMRSVELGYATFLT